MIEQDNQALGKLCYLFEKIRRAELEYTRAQYRVSYYRKIQDSMAQEILSGKYSKWTDKTAELATKIEKSRLTYLKKYGLLLEIQNNLREPIRKLAKKTKAKVKFAITGNCVLGIEVHEFLGQNRFGYICMPKFKEISRSEAMELAEQYEATLVLDKAINSSKNKKGIKSSYEA